MRIVLLLLFSFLVCLDSSQETRGKNPKFCKKPKGKLGSIYFKNCDRYECIKKKKKAVWQKSFAEDKCCLFDSVAFPEGSTMLSTGTSDSCVVKVKCADVGGRLGPAISIRNVCPVCTTTSPTSKTTTPTTPTTTKEACLPGWTMNGVKCYKYFSSRESWASAESKCLSLKAHLASIHNQEEQDLISSIAPGGAWIGGTQTSSSSPWSWSDGTPFAFTNWDSREPNNAGGNEDCIETNKGNGKWNDEECSDKIGYVCQQTGCGPDDVIVASGDVYEYNGYDAFKVENLLTLENPEVFGKNYWLPPDGKGTFVLNLGCSQSFAHIKLVNTHNGSAKDRSTRQFKLYTSQSDGGPWTQVLDMALRDSRQQTDPLPVQTLALDAGRVKAQFVKFHLVSWWGDYGGGLQYFDIVRVCAVFYEHAKLTGASFSLNEDNNNLEPSGWNDRISSVSITSGCTVTLYQHSEYRGKSISKSSGSWEVMPTVSGFNWNEHSSSIKCSCT